MCLCSLMGANPCFLCASAEKPGQREVDSSPNDPHVGTGVCTVCACVSWGAVPREAGAGKSRSEARFPGWRPNCDPRSSCPAGCALEMENQDPFSVSGSSQHRAGCGAPGCVGGGRGGARDGENSVGYEREQEGLGSVPQFPLCEPGPLLLLTVVVHEVSSPLHNSQAETEGRGHTPGSRHLCVEG